MRCLVRRMAAVIAVTFVALAVAVIATPGVSSAQCDRNMSWNRATFGCETPPPPPAWYTLPPPYAPSFAGQDVPPPPPRPSWAPQDPMWRAGINQWGVYVGYVWIPL